jgi:hypothetical protein
MNFFLEKVGEKNIRPPITVDKLASIVRRNGIIIS